MGLLVFEVLFNQQSRYTVGDCRFCWIFIEYFIEYTEYKCSYIMIIIKINDNSCCVLTFASI